MGCGSIFKVLGPSRTPVPTGLIVIFIFVCRGGYYPPAFLVFKKLFTKLNNCAIMKVPNKIIYHNRIKQARIFLFFDKNVYALLLRALVR